MIEPYGGRLVHRELLGTERTRRIEEAPELPQVHAVLDQLYDAEKICTGAYSPLEGFMGSAEIDEVLRNERLTSGLPWTMPIFLTVQKGDEEEISSVSPSDTVCIADASDRPIALMDVEERFIIDRRAIARGAYGTEDTAHPNVADIMQLGETALSGRLQLLNSVSDSQFEYTPAETREMFGRKGWNNVAAYQARNPPHTAHEYIQRLTLEREDIDGLFIQPVIGKLKKGDYRPEVIMDAYSAFVSNYYREDRVLLGSLSISMRYAGPKAVIFYAIVRRNYGCSHYIVGRDQAGVGDYYEPYAAHRIFDRLDVGVVPLRYAETFYCRKCGLMVSSKLCPHGAQFHESTSQTRIRQLLKEGKELPHEILRPEVAEILKKGDVIGS